MKVTFDSNAWQPAVRPDKFPADPRSAGLHKINAALKAGDIEGYISETCGTLEAIGKAARAQHFAGQKAKTTVTTTPEPGGVINISLTIGPDHSQHPGLHPVMADRIRDALEIGVRLLSAPRIGMPSPSDFLDTSGNPDPAKYAQWPNLGAYIDRYSEVGREIEDRGVGFAVIRAIGSAIQARTGASDRPWFSYFALATPAEKTVIGKAVAEWADGDALASHIASSADYFCTEDQGKSAGLSVLNPDNRLWAETTHGVKFVTLAELAGKLP